MTDINSEGLITLYTLNNINLNVPSSTKFPEVGIDQESKLYSLDSVTNVTVSLCKENYCQVSAYDRMNGSPIYHESQLLCLYSGNPGYCQRIHKDKLDLNKRGAGFSILDNKRHTRQLESNDSNKCTCACDCRKSEEGLGPEFTLSVLSFIDLWRLYVTLTLCSKHRITGVLRVTYNY